MTAQLIRIATLDGDTLHIAAGDFRCTIAAKDIAAVWNGLVLRPERRARGELTSLATRLNVFAARVAEILSRGGTLDVAAECERYARRHVSLTRRAWALDRRAARWNKAYNVVYAHYAHAVEHFQRGA